eukprot:scaffold22779_cov67-Phaeocystis_antarctica.AAC.7
MPGVDIADRYGVESCGVRLELFRPFVHVCHLSAAEYSSRDLSLPPRDGTCAPAGTHLDLVSGY